MTDCQWQPSLCEIHKADTTKCPNYSNECKDCDVAECECIKPLVEWIEANYKKMP